ncbi:MAG: hypothetical protein AcusKO_24580 [Acuticoccus sp.]
MSLAAIAPQNSDDAPADGEDSDLTADAAVDLPVVGAVEADVDVNLDPVEAIVGDIDIDLDAVVDLDITDGLLTGAAPADVLAAIAPQDSDNAPADDAEDSDLTVDAAVDFPVVGTVEADVDVNLDPVEAIVGDIDIELDAVVDLDVTDGLLTGAAPADILDAIAPQGSDDAPANDGDDSDLTVDAAVDLPVVGTVEADVDVNLDPVEAIVGDIDIDVDVVADLDITYGLLTGAAPADVLAAIAPQNSDDAPADGEDSDLTVDAAVDLPVVGTLETDVDVNLDPVEAIVGDIDVDLDVVADLDIADGLLTGAAPRRCPRRNRSAGLRRHRSGR